MNGPPMFVPLAARALALALALSLSLYVSPGVRRGCFPLLPLPPAPAPPVLFFSYCNLSLLLSGPVLLSLSCIRSHWQHSMPLALTDRLHCFDVLLCGFRSARALSLSLSLLLFSSVSRIYLSARLSSLLESRDGAQIPLIN
jgi:hypothetical protein